MCTTCAHTQHTQQQKSPTTQGKPVLLLSCDSVAAGAGVVRHGRCTSPMQQMEKNREGKKKKKREHLISSLSASAGLDVEAEREEEKKLRKPKAIADDAVAPACTKRSSLRKIALRSGGTQEKLTTRKRRPHSRRTAHRKTLHSCAPPTSGRGGGGALATLGDRGG